MLNFKLWEADSHGITVYHGSREGSLQRLKGGMPPYEGGLGYGVYVGTEPATGEFYGPHVYELVTKFGWDQVLRIGDDNYEPIESGDSILVGETVPPFSFWVKGKKYSVTGGRSASDSVGQEVFVNKLQDLLGVEYHHSGPRETEHAWRYLSAIRGSLAKLMRNYDFDLDYFKDEIDQWVYRSWDEREWLPGQPGQVAQAQKKMQMDKRSAAIWAEFQKFVRVAQKQTNMGEEIGLEDVGGVVQEAGYRGVYVVGIRHGSGVNEELLVFDEKDLKMVRKIS